MRHPIACIRADQAAPEKEIGEHVDGDGATACTKQEDPIARREVLHEQTISSDDRPSSFRTPE